MKYFIRFTFLLCILTSMSCSQKKKITNYDKVLGNLKLLRIQQMNEVSEIKDSHFSTNSNGTTIQNKLNPVVAGFCKMISYNNLENPFEIDKYFSNKLKIKNYKRYISILKGLEDHCETFEILLDKYPLLFVKYNLKSGKKVYGTFRVNENKKVSSFFSFLNGGFDFDHKLIEMSDGTKISTTIFKNKNGPKKTIFLKTPYFHTNIMTQYIFEAMSWVGNGYSYVIQSNRGSHASTGSFKWLHELNVQDSKETVDWIAKQDFNNGEVISYGTSYDGYNALAASVGRPSALKSVIACSAPANAQTDSFTAGETIEKWLISYVATRENSQATGRFKEKIQYLTTHNIPYEKYDNYLYGRDLADWQDLMDAKKTGSLKNYWKSRSLLLGLKDVTIPIFHIAGLTKDQDSRDTVLTYRYLQENAKDPSSHRLYLHKYGHGCGNFLQKKMATDFLNGDYDNLSQEYRDSFQNNSTIIEIEEKFESIQLPMIASSINGTILNEEVAAKINNRFDIKKDKSAILSYIVSEDIQVNGVGEIELKVKSTLFMSNLSILLMYTKVGVPQSPHPMTWGRSRSSFVLNESSEEVQTIKLTLPPMAFKVLQGETIQIVLSAVTRDFFDIFSTNRREYYSNNEDAGYIKILNTNDNILILPIEKPEELYNNKEIENTKNRISE